MIQGDNNIAQAACEHFKEILTSEEKLINENTFYCIPRMIIKDKNTQLTNIPTMDELKEVVFSINPNFVASPDGMNGTSFKSVVILSRMI